jgi:hypothetical protein
MCMKCISHTEMKYAFCALLLCYITSHNKFDVACMLTNRRTRNTNPNETNSAALAVATGDRV